MNLKNNYDGLIFDLDGTLWDSSVQVCESWNYVLKNHTSVKREALTVEELQGCMGLTMSDIAAKLFLHEDKEQRELIMSDMCKYENEYLSKNGAVLYEGMKETIAALSERYPLFIVSNCQDGYIEAFIKAHGMAGYFKDTECWGRTKTPKSESNKLLISRNFLKNPVYIGDTAGDALAAKNAGIPFIHAAYGFGQVSQGECICRINDIRNLKDILL